MTFDGNIFFGLILAGIFSGFGNAIGTKIANRVSFNKQNKQLVNDEMYNRLTK